ncbi:MAG TPA: lipid-binding SYLF domain-containing protein [Candidatus Binatia bacterium]|nr:lipid-binding SYLF domain-containing protein [Candidatus Binatia bacterium]
MNRKLFAIVISIALATPLFAQSKQDERLANSARVFQDILTNDKGLQKHIVDQAYCVLIFPSVKKVAIGIGSSYGRGALVCRKGADMKGAWGAPAMYALDQGSVGIQLGSTATDFVLVVVSHKGVEQILNGKTKIGGNAAAAAGPSGAEATNYNAQAMNVDVLTYSRSKGLFAGVSLQGASMDVDNDANKAVYGKEEKATDIVQHQAVPPAAKPLVDLLDKTSPARS